MLNPRRSFLKILAAAPVIACGGNPATAERFGDVPAGNVADTSVGSLASVTGAPAVLGRDPGGLYAMTNTCTHQGCPVSPAAGSTLYCSCHGSSFNSNGAVLSGPASAPLVHYAVTVDAAGNITVHGATQVAEGVRTAIA